MSPVQDVTAEGMAKLWSRMKTVAITTTAASGDVTVHTTTSGLYFLCFYLYVQSANAISVTFKSGSTAISGAIPFLAVGEKIFVADGVPVFKGRAAGDAFVLNASGSTDLRGFAMIAERE